MPELTLGRRAGMGLLFAAIPLGCFFIAKYLPLGLLRTMRSLRRYRDDGHSANESVESVAFAVAMTVAFVFPFAVAFAGAAAAANPYTGPFAGAVAVAVTCAILGAGALKVSGAQAGAGAQAVTFAFSGAVIFVGVGAGTSVGTAIFTTAGSVIALSVYHYLELRRANMTSRREFFSVCLAALALLLPGFLAIVWFSDLVIPDVLLAEGFIFLVLFFFSLAPLLNALSDWFSLAATRWFLARYLAKPSTWAWSFYLVVDIALALLLTGLLYAALLAVLEGMQHYGWGVDADAIRGAFLADPWNPTVSWLTWMGISNFLPTLLHLATVAAALWLGVDGEEAKFLKSQVKKLDGGQALTTTDAQRLAIFFTARRWLGRGIGIAAVGGACVQWGQPTLTWIVRWPIWLL